MPVIDIQDLHYAYPAVGSGEPRWVLRGFDLAVEAGTCVGIVGATGSGKTTLCQALLGLVPQATGGVIRGRVSVLGLDVRHTPVADVARRVGLVFQDPDTQLFNLTAEEEIAFGLENLGLPSESISSRVAWALDKVGLSPLATRAPHELSGGEKQRLAIAVVLAMAPEVLILDEPISSLDPQGKSSVQALISELVREVHITTLIVEQDTDWLAGLVDRVAVIRDGQVALEGPSGKVFGQPARLRELGVGPPQLSELAAALQAKLAAPYAFSQLGEAERVLREDLRAGG